MTSKKTWAVVVAQLVERMLPIPEVRSLNPVIGKNLYWTFFVNCIEKTKMKIKRPGMSHLKKYKMKDMAKFFLKKVGQPQPIFLFFSKNNLQKKTVYFSGIRTQIVGVEGEHADHLTTTTTHGPPPRCVKVYPPPLLSVTKFGECFPVWQFWRVYLE